MTTHTDPPMERRSFLKYATHALGALFALLLGFPAIAYLIDPRNRAAKQGDFKRVARLSELQKDVPFQAVIRDVRRDAWTLHPDDVVGRVWLIKRGDDKVDAYTTICPHLGCSINFDKENTKFFICPCHNGTWYLSGDPATEAELGRTNPAPRGLDSLDVQLVKDGETGDAFIEVKYQNFIQGRHDKVAKA